MKHWGIYNTAESYWWTPDDSDAIFWTTSKAVAEAQFAKQQMDAENWAVRAFD